MDKVPQGEHRARARARARKKLQESLTFEFEETDSMEKPKEPAER